MTTVPDGMPTLSSGGHSPSSGRACVMEYVSLIAGETWSDRPACTNPALAGMARAMNDSMSDEGRHLLVPMITRLIGTNVPLTQVQRETFADAFDALYNEMLSTSGGLTMPCMCGCSGTVTTKSDQQLADILSKVIDKFYEITELEQQTYLTEDDLRTAARMVNA